MSDNFELEHFGSICITCSLCMSHHLWVQVWPVFLSNSIRYDLTLDCCVYFANSNGLIKLQKLMNDYTECSLFRGCFGNKTAFKNVSWAEPAPYRHCQLGHGNTPSAVFNSGAYVFGVAIGRVLLYPAMQSIDTTLISAWVRWHVLKFQHNVPW